MRPIGGRTTVYGVIGDPVEHTLSPLMHNRALEAMEVDAVYVAFRVSPQYLEHAIRAVSALRIQGLNVTVPHKTTVMSYLERVTDDARAVGAVNTISNDHGALIGDNTDIHGFSECVLRDGGVRSFPARVCILGAGGSARGVTYACAIRDEVEEIIVLNRTLSRAQELARDIGAVTGKRIVAASSDIDTQRATLPTAGMVVNTTTLGMYPETDGTPAPDPGVFRPGQLVCDIIYAPLQTRFLREASEHGAKTIGGLAMLAYQGAKSLSLWTGKDAPAEVMIDALRGRFDEE